MGKIEIEGPKLVKKRIRNYMILNDTKRAQ